MTVLLLKLHASHSVVARIVLARMVDLNKQKSLFFMELFLYLIFLDLDKMDIYRDKADLSCILRKRAMMELFGIISDRPRNFCCGLTYVLSVA